MPYAHVVFTVPRTTGVARIGTRHTPLFPEDSLLDPSFSPLPLNLGFLPAPEHVQERHHPHLHHLVPAGGLAFNQLPLDPNRTPRVLPRYACSAACPASCSPPQAEPPAQRTASPRWLNSHPTRLSLTAWRPAPTRVGGLSKPPFGGPEHVRVPGPLYARVAAPTEDSSASITARYASVRDEEKEPRTSGFDGQSDLNLGLTP